MNQRIILFLIALTAFINPFMISSVNIAIVEIEKTLGITSTLTSWIITSYMLSTVISLLPSGKLADIFGKRRIFIIGVFIFGISSFLCGISENFTLILISRVLQGIGGGMFLATGTAILTLVFPKEKRGKVLGINVSCVYMGLSLGPLIGGFITTRYGWNKIFLITAAIDILIIIFAYYKMKFDDIKKKTKLNLGETVVYIFFIVSFIYGLSILNQLSGVMIFVLSIILLFYLINMEKSFRYPLINIKKFFTNNVFIFSNIAALINYTATNAITFFLSIYLQTSFNLTPKDAGLILLTQPIIMSIISPFAGKSSDNTEPHIIASIGMLLTTVSLLMIVFINSDIQISYIVLILIVAGIGFGLFSSPNTNAVMSSVSKRDYSRASAILATSRVIGQSLSMGISTLIISIYMADKTLNENPELILKSIKTAFVIFSLLSFAGIFFSLKRGKIHKSKEVIEHR